jgi:hypothetical protein
MEEKLLLPSGIKKECQTQKKVSRTCALLYIAP